MQIPTETSGTQTVTGGSYHDNTNNGVRLASNFGGVVITDVKVYGNSRVGIEITETTSNIVVSNATTHDNAWSGRDDNGREVASGHYIYQLIAGNRQVSKRMIYLK